MKPECHACLGPHDDQFHQSLKRILQWKVQRSVVTPVAAPQARTFTPGFQSVKELRSPSAKRKAARK